MSASDRDLLSRALLSQLQAALEQRLPPDRGVPFSVIARQRLKIRTKDGTIVPFVFNDVQRRYLAIKRLARMQGKAARFIILKSRRIGFTTIEQGISYDLVSRTRNANVLTMAQDGEAAAKLFKIPTLMQQRDPIAPPIKGPGNQYRMVFPTLNSFFYVGTAAGTSVSRGDTMSRVHWSEVAWSCLGWNQTAKQRQLLSGLTEAASHGEVVLESTPNGSELFREIYLGAKAGKNEWTAVFFRWFDDVDNYAPIASEEEGHDFFESFDEEEKRLFEKHGLSLGQMKWRRKKKAELKHLFYQEYPEDDVSCWLMSGTPFFTTRRLMEVRELVESIMGECVEHPTLGRISNGAKWIDHGYEVQWVPPVPNRKYSMGVDCSEGIPGCDPNGLGVMDSETGEQVFALHGHFPPTVLANHICRVRERYGDCLVGIERENHGHAVIQKVQELGLEVPHDRGGFLFHFTPTIGVKREDQDTAERRASRAGWSTNVSTRPIMLESLRSYVEDDGAETRIRDVPFLEECGTFRLQSDGQFRHDSGCHDDRVVKWAIANRMRFVNRLVPQIWFAG